MGEAAEKLWHTAVFADIFDVTSLKLQPCASYSNHLLHSRWQRRKISTIRSPCSRSGRRVGRRLAPRPVSG
ncbi:MAG TPA: hypothetical protein DEB63_03285 [Agrobacterium sp.]|nr:hypothetical protein [Agrobacterium sp.]